MVKGLDLFRDHFQEFSNQFVLIGGAACDIALENADFDFRSTKDLDIVLFVEALNAEFGRAFWDFVRFGGYKIQEKADGSVQFFRFQRPSDDRYPFMFELFARAPERHDDEL